jgi:hypothetical protein
VWQAEKITALTNAASVEVEPIWATLLAKALEGKNVKDLLSNVGAGGGGYLFTPLTRRTWLRILNLVSLIEFSQEALLLAHLQQAVLRRLAVLPQRQRKRKRRRKRRRRSLMMTWRVALFGSGLFCVR